jgi:hypothetical protein
MKIIKNIFFLILILFIHLSVLAASDEKINIHVWGYIQPFFNSESNAFSIKRTRGFVTGNYKSFRYKVEMGRELQKAEIGLSFAEHFEFIFGQQNNSFKLYIPSPNEKHVVNDPFALVPSGQYNAIGATLAGHHSWLEWRFSLLNGTGINKRDDNKDKDTVAWIKFNPWKTVHFTLCWQGGWQGMTDRYYRSGQWIQTEWKAGKFTFIPVWIRRNDLDQQGWFIKCHYGLPLENQIIIQYTDRKFNQELLLGAALFSYRNSLKFIPNLVLMRDNQDGYHVAGYVMLQVTINRD